MSVVDFRRDQRIRPNERNALREFTSELGQEIVHLANRLGVKVFTFSLSDDHSGYLEYSPDCGSKSGFRIVINEAQSASRQRFSVAHELAHFVLHRDDPEFQKRAMQGAELFDYPVANRCASDVEYEDWEKRLETEANRFASVVLMPGHLVRPHPLFQLNRPIEFAQLFGFSEQAVKIRFKELDFQATSNKGESVKILAA